MQTLIKQRGIAAVEAAIVLPIMALLLVASAEFGRAFYQSNTLTKATEDGARYLADQVGFGDTGQMAPLDILKDVIERAKNLVVYGHPNPADGKEPLLPGKKEDFKITITPNGTHFSVSVNYTYQPIFGTSLPFTSIATTFNFQPTVTMRVL